VTSNKPFDAVLVIAFGGPEKPSDIEPFLKNVLRGKRVPPNRIREVAHHYEKFGGYSPITELTRRQANGLAHRLTESGLQLPVYVGMRNWHPFLADTLREMSNQGIRRAIGFIAAPHRGYSSCTQYRENVMAARQQLYKHGLPDIKITYVDDWHDHKGFIVANSEGIRRAINKLPPSTQKSAKILFTAHSVPKKMAGAETYSRQIQTTAKLIANHLERTDWAVVYQSRSGHPSDPWLEPDICEYLSIENKRGLQAAVISPIGFVCDHVEVLYDLDHKAAAVCEKTGLPMTRAHTVNDHPKFLDMMTSVVKTTYDRYATGQPIEILPNNVQISTRQYQTVYSKQR